MLTLDFFDLIRPGAEAIKLPNAKKGFSAMLRFFSGVPCLIGVMLFGVIGTAHSATVSISPSLDGDVTDSPIDGIFDVVNMSSLSLNVSYDEFPGSSESRTFMEFDLSPVNAGSAINSATLAINATPVQGGTIELWGYAGDGIANTTDVDISGKSLLERRSVTASSDVFFDVTLFIQGLVNGDEEYAGFVFKPENFPDPPVLGITSSEAFIGRRPSLDIDYEPIPEVPVPAAFWLFGTALIGLVGFSKRRKAA